MCPFNTTTTLVLNEWSEEMTKYITSPCSSSSTVYSDDSERSSHSFICLHSDDLIRDIAMCIYSPIPEVSENTITQ